MGTNDVTGWRIRLLVFMIVILGTIYTVNYFFVSGGLVDLNKQSVNNSTAQGFTPNAVDVLLNLLFFTYVDNPILVAILNTFLGICWGVNAYIVYTFIRDWSPLT